MKTKKLIKSDNLFPVIGIGASAGGLDSFKKFIKAIPENSGMAYVLVQHLDPNHDSILSELLQKVTNIPVLEISDDMRVKPDHIYVIPSNKMMIASDGVLLLTKRPAKNPNEQNLPIDLFFSSLAEIHQSHAIGVVLSGTASDGTLGLKAIKDHGGITFAQDEVSAAYEGMPQSAAKAGVVDFILSPDKIPAKILEVNKTINGKLSNEEEIEEKDEWVYKQIISLLRIRKGTDFTYYKQSTIRRRILRRMALNKNTATSAYLKFLRENKNEQDILYQDLLIPLTSFFRDDKTFDNLCENVFPNIVKNKTSNAHQEATNEELLSSSEELQSLNEELETNKEELQSTNEELTVINHEMIGLNEYLTEERDYSRAIIATIHEAMLILDEGLRIKSVNNSFLKTFQVSEKEIKDFNLFEINNQQWCLPKLKKIFHNLITKNIQFHDYEIKLEFPLIGEKILLLNASRIIQKSQGEQLILLAIYDVTDVRRKAIEFDRIEKELLKKNIQLGKLEEKKLKVAVNKRNKELIELNKKLTVQYIEKQNRAKELIQANIELKSQNTEKEKREKELIEINKELSAFTYIASHDLQEPLRKIQLFISRITENKEQILTEKNTEYFNKIQLSANRMQILINDLLNYSRVIETKEKNKKIDLNVLLDKILKDLALVQTIENKKANIIYKELPVIDGIPFQIEQLLTNLIENSIKFSEEKREPLIKIKAKKIKGDKVPDEKAEVKKNYYKISVTDNGIGFEQKYAEKIFILFQRLHNNQTYSGTGIGLAICKKIIENHNGFLNASSIPDHGTTFNIFLPAS